MSVDNDIELDSWSFDVRSRTTLEAIAARLIPSDDVGAGANESGAAVYIENALASDYRDLRETYARGLTAVEQHARASYGGEFTGLSDEDKDALLTELERGLVPGSAGESTEFFELLLQHTFEGTFGDPWWGGNAGGVGWALMGYPGPSFVWTEQAQQLDMGAGEGPVEVA